MPSKSQSCRGVAFETKMSATADETVGPTSGRWVWLPWTQPGSFKIHPLGQRIQSSFRQPSSHYCDEDLEDDDDKDIVVIDDIETQMPLPVVVNKPKPKESFRLSTILLDQGLFTMYKRLFVVSFLVNIILLAMAASGRFPYAKARPALFCIGNVLALTVCRSEAFLRVVFWLTVKVLGRDYVPLFVKTSTTSFLQSIGGIHSGCGVSSVAWLIYALVLSLNDTKNNPKEIIGVSSSILSLLFFSCLAAFPLVRHLHHNVFERTHRFAGWTALALLWVFVVLTTCYDSNTGSYHVTVSKLVKRQELWLTLAITILTILPWITVRRVPVSVTVPSGHASIIKFSGGVQAGLLGRISRSPLSEWHAFGIISDGKDSHIMLVGAVGDFTKGLVSNPPKHLYVRGVHFAGLPYLVNMYRRVVLVATGSGICPFLSYLLQKGYADVCVVWVTKGVELNFGSEIKEMMSGHPSNKVIVHDTAVLGRPNVPEMTIEAAKNWKAELVVVTSNPIGSKEIVEACRTAGIAAFGPIWDS